MRPSCHHAKLSGAVGPKWFRGRRYQIFSLNTYIRIILTPENTNNTKKCKHILVLCCTLCKLSPCNNTPAKHSSFAHDMLDYITKKANLSRFQRYRGKFVFSIVYGVSVMRLMCAPDSFLWDKDIFICVAFSPARLPRSTRPPAVAAAAAAAAAAGRTMQ